MLIYLDSSTILKRYLEELGSAVTDTVFDKAQSGILDIGFNVLNTGEVIGIIDKYRRRGDLSASESQRSLEKLFGESLRLLNIKKLHIHPCSFSVVIEAWDLVIKHQLYIVDAIQITSARQMNSDMFLSGDKKLILVAKKEKLNAFNIESENKTILRELT